MTLRLRELAPEMRTMGSLLAAVEDVAAEGTIVVIAAVPVALLSVGKEVASIGGPAVVIVVETEVAGIIYQV